jgi:hypothetical protein
MPFKKGKNRVSLLKVDVLKNTITNIPAVRFCLYFNHHSCPIRFCTLQPSFINKYGTSKKFRLYLNSLNDSINCVVGKIKG